MALVTFPFPKLALLDFDDGYELRGNPMTGCSLIHSSHSQKCFQSTVRSVAAKPNVLLARNLREIFPWVDVYEKESNTWIQVCFFQADDLVQT